MGLKPPALTGRKLVHPVQDPELISRADPCQPLQKRRIEVDLHPARSSSGDRAADRAKNDASPVLIAGVGISLLRCLVSRHSHLRLDNCWWSSDRDVDLRQGTQGIVDSAVLGNVEQCRAPPVREAVRHRDPDAEQRDAVVVPALRVVDLNAEAVVRYLVFLAPARNAEGEAGSE
jgi:hypothetical protein